MTLFQGYDANYDWRKWADRRAGIKAIDYTEAETSKPRCTCVDFPGDSSDCPIHGGWYDRCECVLPEQSCELCRTNSNVDGWEL